LPDPEPRPDPKRPSKLSHLAGDRGFESLFLRRFLGIYIEIRTA
jgi:hypothetical protein